MSDNLTIRGLIERVQQGTIRIPKFQRGFVWEPEDVAFLMDSIYRGYPFGTVLLWRTQEQLSSERDLGPFKLPEPAKKWPIDYVLDGQQRLTSLFGVFQTILEPTAPTDSFDIFFDLAAKEGALEEQFVARSSNLEITKNLFPLRLLLEPAAFALRTRELDTNTLTQVTELQRRFQEAQIRNDVIEVSDREQIAMIFERTNRAGVRLDTFQLLTAWTWSNEFDLNERIDALGADVQSYGFVRIGDEQDLLMKCCAAVIKGDASVKTIVELHGPTVRDRFETIKRGILGAIEFLRVQLNVHSLEVMPYPAMLVPLTRFFATDAVSGFHPSAKQLAQLKRWFWRSCFSRRYSSGVGKAHAADINAMDTIKADDNADPAGFAVNLTGDFFQENNFNIGAVNTKMFILLLASNAPKSLLSSAVIKLEDVLLRCNRNEFHHIYPRNHLMATGVKERINALANFCFLSSADNQRIKDREPSDYISMIDGGIQGEVFRGAILPTNWQTMSYEQFLQARGKLLCDYANTLMA